MRLVQNLNGMDRTNSNMLDKKQTQTLVYIFYPAYFSFFDLCFVILFLHL
jgi:hypothetical protein